MTRPDGNRPRPNKYIKAKSLCLVGLVFKGAIPLAMIGILTTFFVIDALIALDILPVDEVPAVDEVPDLRAGSVVNDMLAPGAANEILVMASTIDKEPFYLVLLSALTDIGLMVLAAIPGGVMLLYPKWKQYAPPIIPFNGYRDTEDWLNQITIHWICLVLSFCFIYDGELFQAYGQMVWHATSLVAMCFFWITLRKLIRLEKDLETMDTPGGADTTS